MFGRKKNKDVDWTANLGQPVPAQPAEPAASTAAEAPQVQIPGLTPGQAKVVQVTTKLTGTPRVQVIGGASQEQIKQAMDMAERFMNADLDGDGKVAGGAAAPGASGLANMLSSLNAGMAATPPAAAPAPGEPDMVSQLERLAKLHESGALTDEEFATEKAKLIGS